MFGFSDEEALFYGFIVLTCVIVCTLVALLCHAGLLTSFDIKTCRPIIGKIKIAYKCGRGPYKESGILFTEMHSLLPEYRTLGVYYDDPKKKEQSRLRYVVGLILSEEDSEINAEAVKTLTENGYKFATFPKINHVVQTTFPFQSTLSIIMAIYRVYPALSAYVTEKNLCAHPYIEVYDNKREQIIFYGPLEKQDEFYVPEILEFDQGYEDDDNQSTVSYDGSVNRSLRDSQSLGYESSFSFSHSRSRIVGDGGGNIVRKSESKGRVDFEGDIVKRGEVSIDEGIKVEESKAAEDIKCEMKTDKDNEANVLNDDDGHIDKDSLVDENGDSDANTVSSFEEIDETDIPADNQVGATHKDEL